VPSLPQRATVREHLALDDQSGVAYHRLKPHRATPAEAMSQSGSLAVPARGTYPADFLDQRHFKSPLRLFMAFSSSNVVSNVVATANQRPDNRASGPTKLGDRINTNITDDMRSGPDQRPRGRFNTSRPFKQQPRISQNNQTFDSSGPNIKIRGSAHQIFERYLALAREATASGDRIAAENLYQHAEHYFRVNNARREGNQQGTPPRPTTPADVEMNSSEADSREVDQDRFQPQWDGDDSVSSEPSTY
jgi:hypothetical protein